MENDATPTRDEITAALREDERATAAVWLDYPPTPLWNSVAGGVWFAVLAWAATADSPWANLVLVPLIALVAIDVRWKKRRRGAAPAFRGAPRELNRVLWGFFVVAAVLVAASVAIDHVAGRWWGIGFVLVAVSASLWTYERAYDRAADRARQRLA